MFDGGALALVYALLTQPAEQVGAICVFAFDEIEVADFAGNRCARLRALSAIAKSDFNTALRSSAHSLVAHLGLAENSPHVVNKALLGTLHHCGHVYLHEKVHAAAQIEPEVHRLSAQQPQTGRCFRQQVERHRVAVTQCLLRDIARLELGIDVGKSESRPLLVKLAGNRR